MLPAPQTDVTKPDVTLPAHSSAATLSCRDVYSQLMTSTEGTHTLDLIQSYQGEL